MKNIFVIGLLSIVIIVSGYVVLSYFGVVNNTLLLIDSKKEKNLQDTAMDTESILSQKIECQKVGEIEHEENINTLEENTKNSNIRAYVSAGPEYAYNKKLDTCLYFVGITSNLLEEGKQAYSPSNTVYDTLLIVKDVLANDNVLYFEGRNGDTEAEKRLTVFEAQKQLLFNEQ